MIASHDGSACPTPKNALLRSAQTRATDLGKITTSLRPDFKDRLTPTRVNEFPSPAN